MSYRFSVDIGGTFTDLLIFVETTGEMKSYKTPTTPHDLTEGVMKAVELAARDLGLNVHELLEKTSLFIHGTTVSTNALIEKKVGKVGMLTTKGFREVILAREGGKERPFFWKLDYPSSFVPRYLILPITERINSEGEIEIPLHENEVRGAVRKLRGWDVDAIAVCFLWSIANPFHEERTGKIIEEEWPEVPYDLSYKVNPIIREYRRFIATVINCSLHKIVDKYMSKLTTSLKERDFAGDLLITISSGGVTDPAEILNKPILTVGSGPSMLPVAALQIGMLERNTNNIIGVDMGGTSFDTVFVRNGEISTTRESKIDPREEGGDKLGILKVDVESMGAGGGSIAWIDPAGYIHVGPQSAGAYPGPACYGTGGEEPTVTDADLVLGYLNPRYFLGGRIKLQPDKAEGAIKERIAEKLCIDVVEAAARIYTTINYNMILGFRSAAVKKGIDPRDLLFVGGGGAFGVHAAEFMRGLEIKEALVPRNAGVLCAFGGLISDVKQDVSKSFYTLSNDFNFEKVNSILAEFEKRANVFLERLKVPPENQELQYFMEARYPYQAHELSIPLKDVRITSENLPEIVRDFHEMHFRYYAVNDPTSAIECISWRVRAIGKIPKLRFKELSYEGENASAALKGRREAFFKDTGFVEVPIYDGGKLGYGNKINGPAIIEEPITTIVVPPKTDITITKFGNYFVKLD